MVFVLLERDDGGPNTVKVARHRVRQDHRASATTEFHNPFGPDFVGQCSHKT